MWTLTFLSTFSRLHSENRDYFRMIVDDGAGGGCQTNEQTALPIMRPLCPSIRRRAGVVARLQLTRSSSSGYLSPSSSRCSSSSLAIYAAPAAVASLR